MKNSVSLFMLAKQHSSRLRGKNNLLFNGVPMYIYNLKKLRNLNCNIYLNSDSQEMLSTASKEIPELYTCLRPESMRDNDLPSVPLFQFMHKNFNLGNSSVLNIQANSPNVSRNLIETAISILTYCQATELLTIYPDSRLNNGSLWGFSAERLLNYGDPYTHKPDILLNDSSVDIHTINDFEDALRQHKIMEETNS